MSQTIFREKSIKNISSPDKLDDYLKVSSPSVWFVLAALVFALIAAGAWCFFGTMPKSLDGIGLTSGGGIAVYVPAENAHSVSVGMEVRISTETDDTISGRVTAVGDIVTSSEAAESAGARWLTGNMPSEWICPLTVELDEAVSVPAGEMLSAQIILNTRRPIDLLFEE